MMKPLNVIKRFKLTSGELLNTRYPLYNCL